MTTASVVSTASKRPADLFFYLKALHVYHALLSALRAEQGEIPQHGPL